MANDREKKNAAAAALEFVEEGMTVGLGTGSTAKFFVELLAEEIADGLALRCVPTSVETERLAQSLGVPLVPVEQVDRLHLTVDGADEVDAAGNLIKGGGAALLVVGALVASVAPAWRGSRHAPVELFRKAG